MRRHGLDHLQTSDAGRAWEAVGRLDGNGQGFCTGALIAQDLVLTAAHCLYDRHTKERIDHSTIEFRSGWRSGCASAYRFVRRAVVHPDYVYDRAASSERVSKDVALHELQRPTRNTTVVPLEIAAHPRKIRWVSSHTHATEPMRRRYKRSVRSWHASKGCW